MLEKMAPFTVKREILTFVRLGLRYPLPPRHGWQYTKTLHKTISLRLPL